MQLIQCSYMDIYICIRIVQSESRSPLNNTAQADIKMTTSRVYSSPGRPQLSSNGFSHTLGLAALWLLNSPAGRPRCPLPWVTIPRRQCYHVSCGKGIAGSICIYCCHLCPPQWSTWRMHHLENACCCHLHVGSIHTHRLKLCSLLMYQLSLESH